MQCDPSDPHSSIDASYTEVQSRASTLVVQQSKVEQCAQGPDKHGVVNTLRHKSDVLVEAEDMDLISNCFNEAITRYNQHLKNESESQWKKLHIDLDTNAVDPTVTAQTLVHVAKRARSKYLRSRLQKSSRSTCDDIVSHLNRYSRSIDVLIQHDPTVSSLIWGPVRALLEVASDNLQASELAVEGVLVIVQHTNLWNRIAALSGRDVGVQEALTSLYFRMLDFLMHAVARFEKGSLRRFGSSLRFGERQRFEIRLKKLQEAAELLRWEAQMESNSRTKLTGEHTLHSINHHVHNSIAVREWIGANANPIVDTRTRSIVKTNDEASLWVLREPCFRKWLEDSTSEVLWLTGKPGSGKSDLAYRLEKALKGSIFGKTVLSHGFQSNYSALQRSPNTLAFSIIDQLWHPDSLETWPAPTIEKLLSLFCRFRKSPDQCQFSSLWSICTDLLKPIGDFILVIDGMDECHFDREDDASVLVDILEDLPRSTRGKVVIFSRPSFLLNIGTTTSCASNEIRVTLQKTQSDLHQLCVAASHQLKWNNTQLQLQALKRVEDNADGSFLWATLAFQELSSIPNDKDIHTFMATKFPDTCQGFYEKGLLRLANGAKERDIEACRSILLALLGRRRVLTIDEVSEAAGLFLTHTGPIISRWLYQLVSVHEGVPILTHPSVRDFLLADEYSSEAPHKLCLSPEEPNAFLAQRCLECLLEEKYGDPNRIARRLRSRFGLESLAEDPIGGFYAYAAENWVVHLTQIESPSRQLLGLAGSFLRSLQFSYWAEYVYTDFGDFQAIRLTQSHLVSWAQELTEDDKALLSLEAYYEVPYKSLNEEYEGRVEDDKTLPWLPLMQLGFYYFDIGRINDMQTIRSYVADGLCKLLGKKNPLALRSRTESAFAYLQKGDLSKARDIWIEVAADQAEVIPEEDRSELYRTQLYRGMAEHLMNDYATAFRTFAYVSAKFLGSKGPTSNMFLVAEMWYARTEAAVGELEKATKTLEEIRKTREDKYGTSDGFGTLTITLLSDIYRKFGEQTRSIQYLKEALKQRTRLWPVTHPLVIDASLRLAITYRDFDLEDEAWEIIDQLQENSQLEEEDKFYEYCQAQHIKALLLFGDGATDEAISIQLRLLIDTEPEKTIRPLQWVRTDVADILRHRDDEGDQDTASALFGGVITYKNQQQKRQERGKDSGDDEPDTPHQLAVAEKALRLCRSESLVKAQELLDEEGFQWTYERSLWLQAGMPAADTTVMKPPRGLGDEALKKSSAF